MENKAVFISYKAEEFEEASWVKATLESNGISCWMAPTSICGGSSYAEEIPKAIRACKVFVLILSDKAQDSKWVPRELDQAINESKIVMPFMLEDCRLKDDFNFYLTNVQRYAAFENKSAAMEKMIREIKAIIGSEKAAVEPDAIPAEPIKENKNPLTEKKPEEKKAREIKKRIPQSKPNKPVKIKNETKSKKALQVIVGIALSIVLITAASIAARFASSVNIAGERVSKFESYLYLSDVTLTDEDINTISKLKKLTSVRIENTSFPNNDIGVFGELNLSDLKLINCNLTDEHIKSIAFAIPSFMISMFRIIRKLRI